MVRDHLAQVLRLAPGDLDADAPFATLGMDSLTGLELRDRLASALGLQLPSTLIFQAETIAKVTGLLADALLRASVHFESDARPAGAVPAPEQEEGRL
jgi:polyketide synthase 12/epothilone polyketide synthase D